MNFQDLKVWDRLSHPSVGEVVYIPDILKVTSHEIIRVQKPNGDFVYVAVKDCCPILSMYNMQTSVTISNFSTNNIALGNMAESQFYFGSFTS